MGFFTDGIHLIGIFPGGLFSVHRLYMCPLFHTLSEFSKKGLVSPLLLIRGFQNVKQSIRNHGLQIFLGWQISRDNSLNVKYHQLILEPINMTLGNYVYCSEIDTIDMHVWCKFLCE